MVADNDRLRPFRVRGLERVFVLGAAPRRRATIFSQQNRALALANRMRGFLTKPKQIAIVGGGIGGLTIARALGLEWPEATIHLLERKNHLLHLLVGCRTRWLHPTIYSWPLVEKSPLPFFDWPDGGEFAHTLAERWLAEWSEFERARGRIFTHLGVEVGGALHQHFDRVFIDVPRLGLGSFDAVVLAVGFGVESIFPGAEDSPTYWTTDELEQELPRGSTARRRILISGIGDGGLIDFVRSRIRGFDHRQSTLEFEKRSGPLRARLRARFGEGLGRQEGDLGAVALTLRSAPEDADLDEWIRSSLRTDTEVTLLGDSPVPFTKPSSFLNRAFAQRILELDALGSIFLRGRLHSVERIGDRVRAHHSANSEALLFDQVIIRHGADSMLRRHFPGIADHYLSDAASSEAVEEPEAIDHFRQLRREFEDAAKKPPTERRTAVHEVAELAGWRLSRADEYQVLRRLDPAGDWANPERGDAIPRSDIAAELASHLDQSTGKPTTDGDIRRLHSLCRLFLAQGAVSRAMATFYERVRGYGHLSLYEWGLFREDREVLGAIRACLDPADQSFENQVRLARIENSLGFCDIALGDLTSGADHLDRAIARRRTVKDDRALAVSLTNRGELHLLRGDTTLARRDFTDADDKLRPSAEFGLRRWIRGFRAMTVHTEEESDKLSDELWALPESPHSYDGILANLTDIRLYALRLRSKPSETRAIDALRHFGFGGAPRRPFFSRWDRAIGSFFCAVLNKRFALSTHGVPSLTEALWLVVQTQDLAWRARAAIAVTRLETDNPEAKALLPEASKLISPNTDLLGVFLR